MVSFLVYVNPTQYSHANFMHVSPAEAHLISPMADQVKKGKGQVSAAISESSCSTSARHAKCLYKCATETERLLNGSARQQV